MVTIADRVFGGVLRELRRARLHAAGECYFTSGPGDSVTAPMPETALASSSPSAPRRTLILVAGLLLLRLATLAAPDLFPEEALPPALMPAISTSAISITRRWLPG